MKMKTLYNLTKKIQILFFIFFGISIYAQENLEEKSKNAFWRHVQFGGGFGLSVGSGFTDITVAPSAIYNFNEYVSLGFGLQGSYISAKNDFNTTLLGGSLIALFNPIDEIQFSVEVEEVNVNTNYLLTGASSIKDNFWNTGLYVGAGFRTDNVIIGARYNLLFDKEKNIYNDAIMPFVRVYF